MAVTGAFVIETILKWAIPFICLAIVGLITARLVNPIKKGNEQARLEEWEDMARKSDLHEELCGKHLQAFQKESEAMDHKILTKLDQMDQAWKNDIACLQESSERNSHDIDIVRQGVLDAHLQNLIQTSNEFIEKGFVTHAELMLYNARLAIYHRLGGNGHMDSWDERVKALPVHN